MVVLVLWTPGPIPYKSFRRGGFQKMELELVPEIKNAFSEISEDHKLDRPSLIGECLTLEAFTHFAGKLAGYPFVKVVVERNSPGAPTIHFINHGRYQFHSDYIAENILKTSIEALDRDIDQFNRSVYLEDHRKFYLGTIALHQAQERFFSLETVEIDTMNTEMVRFFYDAVKSKLDPALPLLFKPANHLQEAIVSAIEPALLPRVFSHELFSKAKFVSLHNGDAYGRLRVFPNEESYRSARATLEWFDIVAMERVPDDIPRVSGIINAQHTTPLSHTNVLAAGWKIPNAIQLGIFEKILAEGLANTWVHYVVDSSAQQVTLYKTDKPTEVSQPPAWSVQRVKLEEPEILNTAIVSLDHLRMSDRYRYGTKAANLGELKYILEQGSDRLLGFYKIKRPPRSHLLAYLAKYLGVADPGENGGPTAPLTQAALKFLRKLILVPRGIAIPFSVQQDFLESSPRMQQTIGKLKMALELNAREVDSLCITLQTLIRQTRLPDKIRNYIDSQIADHLAGVSHFVVRSSSNAEDLEGFSAAGIYESINHVTTAEKIFESIKEVWASLLSPRSVRLRHEVGISLDDCYMGVIVQEEIKADLGGVLVTTNPMNRAADFRNVYINASLDSVNQVVQGSALPYQFLYNTVEGGGRTLARATGAQDLSEIHKNLLQRLAFAGRLLQSHFSPDYTFSMPVDIEWITDGEVLYVLQLRPYSK